MGGYKIGDKIESVLSLSWKGPNGGSISSTLDPTRIRITASEVQDQTAIPSMTVDFGSLQNLGHNLQAQTNSEALNPAAILSADAVSVNFTFNPHDYESFTTSFTSPMPTVGASANPAVN